MVRIITYILLLLFSLPMQLYAQTKRALVIGLGQQQDKAWNKINGDKDVPFVQAMLKNAGFKSVSEEQIEGIKQDLKDRSIEVVEIEEVEEDDMEF